MDNKQSCAKHHPQGETQKGETQKACVSLVPIFNHLAPDQMDEIRQVVRSVSYQKGEVLYHAGDEADSLYIVNQGKIKIYRLSESGKEQLLRILNPGDFTGELALFRESVHEAYAEALRPTDVCLIQRVDLQHLLLKYPTISLEILTEFSHRLETAEKQTTRFATEKVETRIALFLAELLDQALAAEVKEVGIEGGKKKLERVGVGKGIEIELPMSRKDLASYLGTTPETISRRLGEFEAAGYIKQKGQRKIEMIDVDGLLLL